MERRPKIAFALLPEPGHVNPFIGPAQALLEGGCEVVVVSPGDLSRQLAAAGLPFDSRLVREGDAPPPRGRELIELLGDRARYRALIEAFVVEGVREQVAPLVEFLENERPEALVFDPMYYGAAIAAHRLSIPWFGVSSSLSQVLPDDLESEVLTLVRELSGKRAAVFASHGLTPAFRGADVLSPWLNITFATEAFVGCPPAGVSLVGPSRPLGQRGDEVETDLGLPTDRPVVFASLGSQLSHYPEIFEKIIEAGRGLGVFLALSVGDLIDEPRWRQPIDNVKLYRYAPQLALLPRAAAFITHGGANSVMEGLVGGTPLLVTPLCNDQFHQAHFVRRSGVGQVLDLRVASVAELRESLSRLLAPGPIRDATARVARTYQGDGARRAARLIHEHATVR